ncbi:hypothetical protein [Stenotrophomonas maltophilia]|uniref:hypothetical protein n=1 Tax=Stenotrophomonas maltophilia TaxID=40324 RepID=UPI00166154B9|nr:hypothetical protein [Stenotrophomonas maltophilia]
MGLPQDLLKQARHLATKESKRPQQANLRRAVSSAYYALFHLLSAEASARITPLQPAGMAKVVQRALTHADMKSAAKGIVQNPLPRVYALLLGASGPVPAGLADVARTFVTLQEQRHAADYDVSRTFLKSWVLSQVKDVEDAFQKWAIVRQTPHANAMLMAFFLWKPLSSR